MGSMRADDFSYAYSRWGGPKYQQSKENRARNIATDSQRKALTSEFKTVFTEFIPFPPIQFQRLQFPIVNWEN